MGKGIVFNVQRYSIDDGPGIRTTVFLKGCPLRCLWCSNPESQQPSPQLGHRNLVCVRCGKCMAACDLGALSLGDEGLVINRSLCNSCGRCVEACSNRALKLFGEEMSVEEVFRMVVRDIPYYKNSEGGGITVSGGEPLQQAVFTTALFEKCRNEGIHTCLETCGYGKADDIERVLEHTCLVLFDVKHVDPERHRRLTGRTNGPILNNLELIMKKGTPLIIRLPIIPSCNDSAGEIAALANMLKGMKGRTEGIDIMPYHKYGTGKYRMLSLPYELEDIEPPTEVRLEEVRNAFRSVGLKCEVRI